MEVHIETDMVGQTVSVYMLDRPYIYYFENEIVRREQIDEGTRARPTLRFPIQMWEALADAIRPKPDTDADVDALLRSVLSREADRVDAMLNYMMGRTD